MSFYDPLETRDPGEREDDLMDKLARGHPRGEEQRPAGAVAVATIGVRRGGSLPRPRDQYRFKVFKDRKFVATAGLKGVAQGVCTAAGTQNILYELRAPTR